VNKKKKNQEVALQTTKGAQDFEKLRTSPNAENPESYT
jgi:hypothetical protein